MRLRHILALGALLSAAAGPALAQQADPFKDLVDRGLEAYNAKRYDEAIKSFEQAYALRAEPELVYNIARAHEKSLRRSEAVAAYERFVNLPGTTAELRTKALNAIAALRAEQAAMDRASRPPPGAVEPVTTAPPPAAAAPPPATVDTAVRPASRATPVLPWALIGVGGGGVVLGSVFGIMALSAKGDFDAEDPTAPGAAARLVALADDVDRNALVADIAIGAGLAVAGVGVVLLLLDGGDGDGVALTPVVGADRVGLAGRF